MREVAFLQQRAAKWKQFEQLLQNRTASTAADADTLAELFIEVTTDLAYANTFYPNSKTTLYLQGLAADAHRMLYRNKREERSRFAAFWLHEVPLAVRRSHRALLLSLGVFLLALLVGVVSAANDEGYVRVIMGDAYVNMTLENIDRGDPMAVYKQQAPLDMFLAITFNNVRVAFMAFAFGILFSFGTAYVLFSNGVMLGAFQYFFHQEGLLLPSLLVIYIHGTLEISAIVIAGGAGFVLGNSLLFPGTYPRGYSFRQGARRGVKIVTGLVPVFITAGFLEGFVTRHTDMPLTLSLAIIGLSAAFILFYFVFYPRHLYPTLPHDHRYPPHQL